MSKEYPIKANGLKIYMDSKDYDKHSEWIKREIKKIKSQKAYREYIRKSKNG